MTDLRIGLNHLYVVLDEETYKSIASSEFIKNEFAGFEARTTTAGDGRSWTGLYCYGAMTYFEFLPQDQNRKAGQSAIALGVDDSKSILGVLDRLNTIPGVSSTVSLITRESNREKIPWFYRASTGAKIVDDLLSTSVMAWHPEYLRKMYPELHHAEAEVSRSGFLDRVYKSGRHLRDVMGVTIALSPPETGRFLQYLGALGWKIEQLGEKHMAGNPDLKFTVVPETLEKKGIIELDLTLSETSKGDRKFCFGENSVLELGKDKRGKWVF